VNCNDFAGKFETVCTGNGEAIRQLSRDDRVALYAGPRRMGIDVALAVFAVARQLTATWKKEKNTATLPASLATVIWSGLQLPAIKDFQPSVKPPAVVSLVRLLVAAEKWSGARAAVLGPYLGDKTFVEELVVSGSMFQRANTPAGAQIQASADTLRNISTIWTNRVGLASDVLQLARGSFAAAPPPAVQPLGKYKDIK